MSATIVLLTYNGQEYIVEMLDSVVCQTYRPIQLLIADDASTDSTVKIIREYLQNTAKIGDIDVELVVQEQNLGRAGNRNSIISMVTGDYVFLADQDDIWEKDKIEKQIRFLEEHDNCFGVSCDRRLISQNGTQLLESENRYQNNSHHEISDLKENLLFASNFPANCIGFRKDDLERVFSIPVEMEEPDRFLRVMIACKGDIGFINETLVNYRIHTNNVSGNYFAQVQKKPISVVKNYVKKNKRFNRIYSKDDKIILNEVKERFGIDLGSMYKYRKRRTVYCNAFGHLMYDVLKGKIGEFVK